MLVSLNKGFGFRLVRLGGLDESTRGEWKGKGWGDRGDRGAVVEGHE